MTAITIAGGVYHERCIWPDWDQLYGSAGRAAAALSGHVGSITLRGYARPDVATRFSQYANQYGFTFDPVHTEQVVSFEYIHSLSVPLIRPAPVMISPNPPIPVSAPVVLRFGMLEGSARVEAERCVYDPQSAFRPESFDANGSTAKHLAIVANQGETLALGGGTDPIAAARSLLKRGAEVVVVKSGAKGAYIVEASGVSHVSAYRTDRVWTVGSGDVFAAIFAAYWGAHGATAVHAAELASRAVAAYVESMALPVPLPPVLLQSSRPQAVAAGGKVYLASPFFTLGQRWLVDEARRGLGELGLDVFSPVHDVGAGPADQVAPADLAALDACDAVFAILDGTDSGTLFEVGYARARGKPVYALAQTVTEEDLKMVQGSGCRIFDDFVTALHHTAWRT
ncbi:nucleoside 2-deoxyribosyltransferase [Archangium gephyra]|nr:nucleoside 2-deoxyribosyltransferase [Archangium gephyra]